MAVLHTSCFRLKPLVVGGLLLCAALSSAALTLGRARSNVWLGQGVDVSIQVQLEANESLGNLCFEAEVFHADTRQEPGQVRVTVEAGAPAVVVRVRSAVPVDEPVVTVYLRETCATKSSRRYVLLAEVPAEGVNSNALTVLPQVMPASESTAKPVAEPSATAAVSAVGAGGSVAVKRAPDGAVQSRTRPIVVSPAKEKNASASARGAAATSPPVVKPVAPRPVEVPVKPRLKIDPLESPGERGGSPAGGTQAPTPAPAQVSPDDPRLKKLEDSVQALLTLAAKNERGMADLRERLQQAEEAKYDNPLVYGLSALLLAALGGVAYLWRRQQQVRPEAALWPENEQETLPVRGVMSAPAMVSTSTAARYAPAAVTAPVYVTEFQPQSDAPPSVDAEPRASAEATASLANSPEVDLDDLIEPGAGIGSLYAPNAEPSQDAAFPSLAEEGDAGEPPAAEPEPEAPPLAQFPMAGEVTIDVSHLSLTPVEEQGKPVQEAAAPLLDFDFDLTPPATSHQEPEETGEAPPPASGTRT